MELIARVNSHLRRYQQILSLKNNEEENQLIVGDLKLDLHTKEVSVR